MAVAVMEKLREHGWYLTEQGYELVSDYGNISDLQKLIRRAADYDLKEIGSGEGDFSKGDVVLQIQKLRNVACPKNNEESKSAPRMLKLSLTDGKNNFQAVEVQHISSISLNTPPGTKLLMRGGDLPTSHGILLLTPAYVKQVLDGRVSNLVDKWELNKKLASQSRVQSVEQGGPPPWIPFGQKIIDISDSAKTIMPGEKEKASKENNEFEAQRNDAIAEAAKLSNRKIFGGGNKQLIDHTLQKIVDHGFTRVEADKALGINRNNIAKTLEYLLPDDNKPAREQWTSVRETVQKPSSGKISLFDFLEDKLPTQSETADVTNIADFTKERKENTSDRHYSKNTESSQSSRGFRQTRGQRGNRGYQVPPRHLEDKSHKFDNSNSQHNQGNSHKSKPPRFQKNQESQNYFQQDSDNKYNKLQMYFEDVQSNNPTDYGVFKVSQPNHQGRSGSSRNQNHTDDNRDRQAFFGKQNRVQDTDYRMFQNEDTSHGKALSNRFNSAPNEIIDFVGPNNHGNDRIFNANRKANSSNGWVWKGGDKCMAKYWEDNVYYNAEVTAVSKRTCVVKFKDFQNYEEVLKVDCIPITKENPPKMQSGRQENSRRQDQRSRNRIPRFEHGQNNSNAGAESSQTSETGQGNKGFNRKRGQQRGTQAIYQPPPQRSNPTLAQNIY